MEGGGLAPHVISKPFIVDDQWRLNKKLNPMDISPTLRAQSHGNEPKVVEQQTVSYNRKDGIGKEIEVGHTLSASDYRGLDRNQNQNAVVESGLPITSDFRIRKLTPLECFRLQGFPDDLFYKAQEVNSNSQLYKQAGNSVTVNVIEAIANRLMTI